MPIRLVLPREALQQLASAAVVRRQSGLTAAILSIGSDDSPLA